ncbi:MAG: DoxX family protein [Thaumarchaeota archaeon]|nr:DoxX family protein [Nitrososphaerota archaeon]
MPGLLEPFLGYTSYLGLFLRVLVGISLMIHGYPKLKSKDASVNWMKSLGMPGGTAVMSAILEFFGGVLLVGGFIVPIMSLFFAIQFASIVIVKKTKMKAAFIAPGKPSYEIDVTYFLLSIVLLVLGSGALSIDGLIGL